MTYMHIQGGLCYTLQAHPLIPSEKVEGNRTEHFLKYCTLRHILYNEIQNVFTLLPAAKFCFTLVYPSVYI